MAEAVVLDSSSHQNFPFGRVQDDVKMKRKTPSELRAEQLNRRSGVIAANEESASSLVSERVNSGAYGLQKSTQPKIPKYIDTRVDVVYPVKKSSERCRMLYGKEKAKESVSASGTFGNLDVAHVESNFATKGKPLLPCEKIGAASIPVCPDSFAKDQSDKCFRKMEKCSQSVLQDVIGLHLGSDKPESSNVNMEKALKGLVVQDAPAISNSVADSSGKVGDIPSLSSGKFSSEFHVQGHRIPLDFTLKTNLRLVSSSSVKWCHSLSASPTNVGVNHFTYQFGRKKDNNLGCNPAHGLSDDALFSNALISWVYPQSSLPPSLISAMAMSTVRGEIDFLSKRQQDWEDSFQSLYFMLRKGLCNIFYVYTSQFVVLFVGGNFMGKNKLSCNAYVSQSTSGLRSLLRKHDICFSMPLCHAEVERASEDDLVELSEIEKRNLGQTFLIDSLSDVDNSPRSLLAFIGNENVHSLYDFVLNYRFFFNSLTGADVPLLYSPVPFQNASLSIPQVRCKEMKRADLIVSSGGINREDIEAISGLSSAGVCYSIEVKDTILPPWVVCKICAAMSSDGRSYETSLTTDPSSLGLNAALDPVCLKSELSNNCSKENCNAFGIPEAVLSSNLRKASLRHIKFTNGSQVVDINLI
ncbi:protein downstream neighbor of Son [Dioscorea cayenensis subsp. rotundata]|uniref:Protein downstream neighbor of Son n=1 Tax=Dioscorea cayennensis subsp. rotundata TaxID=55577 RepID=A0AB40BVI0_DIOCR|nr:protein downstream neighbor of Son [Dioscorea cayenensis subsp. rotundata]XP_039131433.1 protein downstream neighbor of Son [Dioscorea cayenensis subsp. rotundata]